jgi:hypothetical protein
MGRKWDKLITFCSIWGIKWEIFNVFLGGFDFSDSLLVILWLCLRYIPQTVQSLASAYNEYQQGSLVKENRRSIRKQMEHDEMLSNLPKDRRAELARLIDTLLEHDRNLIPRAKRFMKKSLLSVNIRVKKK